MKYLYRPPSAAHPLIASQPALGAVEGTPIPQSIDLRSALMAPRNQGAEGCCSGFSTAALREQAYAAQHGAPPAEYLSPAYLYGRTRILEGTFPRDAGACLADEMQTLTNYGVCPESYLPYNQDPTEAPTPQADTAAYMWRVPHPVRVACDPTSVKAQLAQGCAVAFGMSVYQSFEATGADGMVPLPSGNLLGGHAMLAVGYDDAKGCVLVRNSWGAEWALAGYCWMPYSFIPSWFEAWSIAPTSSQ